MIRGRDFIVFADDWGRHPSSCQHLFRRIVPTNRVLWVNTIGTRTPTLSRGDLGRAAEKLRGWLGSSRAGEPARDAPVEILNPVMMPFDRFAPLRGLNARLLRRSLRKALALRGVEEPVLVTTIPNAVSVVGELGEKASLYYCVDEFSEWPGADRRAMLAMEEQLLQKVDLVVATSDALFEAKSRHHARVRLLRHGVDWERFHAGTGNVPRRLAALPRPRAGFVGLADARLNVPLLAELARACPDVTFVLVGPRQLAVGELDEQANVRFLPPVDYADVPAVLHALDVALLPYVETRLTQNINPLKLREFLASGLPIVATPLPEVRLFASFVRTARDPAEWSHEVREALREGRSLAAERSASVRSCGWDVRAGEFARYVLEAEATAEARS